MMLVLKQTLSASLFCIAYPANYGLSNNLLIIQKSRERMPEHPFLLNLLIKPIEALGKRSTLFATSAFEPRVCVLTLYI